MENLVMLCLLGCFFTLGSAGIGIPQVCYGPDYGCFDQFPPFANPLMKLPQSPEKIGTSFRLYTRNNSITNEADELDDSDEDLLGESHFDIRRPRTIIVCHGWTETGNGYDNWMIDLKDALLKKGDFNVILVDWSVGANQDYGQSAGNTRLNGAIIANFINFLIYHSGNPGQSAADKFYFIGFSFGAQSGGFAGRRLQEKYGMKLGRITGLDPAGPYFTATKNEVHLDKTDAKYVDIIHTNAGYIGTADVVGHTDFFPNGGSVQTGCAPDPKDSPVFIVGCNHLRATQYFIRTVKEDCPHSWKAYPCSSYTLYSLPFFCNRCGKRGCPLMGYRAEETKLNGKFYLNIGKWNTLCPA
ncbi:inactive pancreatic lipase-related protein 1-like isoform X1 [Acropora muricata]|uniref:inactive pancreatic lipase-related protein 1-like isoform X1 n=1 Tax=Acropora muricata TaxID=159855 RepID=UPI0034E51A53